MSWMRGGFLSVNGTWKAPQQLLLCLRLKMEAVAGTADLAAQIAAEDIWGKKKVINISFMQ